MDFFAISICFENLYILKNYSFIASCNSMAMILKVFAFKIKNSGFTCRYALEREMNQTLKTTDRKMI